MNTFMYSVLSISVASAIINDRIIELYPTLASFFSENVYICVDNDEIKLKQITVFFSTLEGIKLMSTHIPVILGGGHLVFRI